MNEEIELKLAVAARDIDRLRRRRLLTRVEPQAMRLEATYFDTSEHLLSARGMGLRLRREGRHWVQTLKSSAAGGSVMTSRNEWESAARMVNGRPQIDLALLRGSPLPRLLARRGGVAALAPVFRARVLRTVWTLDYRGTQVEVALDVGTLHAHSDGRRRIEPISELELELKSGKPVRLLELAHALVGVGSSAIPLLPLARSKAERGYALALGGAAPTAKASAAGFRNGLTPTMRTTEALRAVVAHGLAVVTANAEAVRSGYAPEHIHQARVALRRMRSAARLFDRDQHDLRPRLAGELRWLTQAINGARDWDVLIGATLPAWLESVEKSAARTGQLLEVAIPRREDARAAAAAALSSARFARAALDLQRWSMSKPKQGRPLQSFAPRALARAHARLFEAARFLSALSPERRHRVRILAKRLRYALDVLQIATSSDEFVRYAERLALLQDSLGQLNDAAVAELTLGGILQGTGKQLFGRWVEEQTAQLLPIAETQLADLSTTPASWG